MKLTQQFILRKHSDRKTVLASLTAFLDRLSLEQDWAIQIGQPTRHRTDAQNRLQQLWHLEAASALGDESPEEKRAFCKLHFGVPILRAESEEFRAQYDEVIRPLPYEKKLALMKVPIDLPITRLMSTDQKRRYLDAAWNHYSSLGVVLTDPSLYGLERK